MNRFTHCRACSRLAKPFRGHCDAQATLLGPCGVLERRQRRVFVALGIYPGRRAAGSALVDMTAQRCSPAGHNGTPSRSRGRSRTLSQTLFVRNNLQRTYDRPLMVANSGHQRKNDITRLGYVVLVCYLGKLRVWKSRDIEATSLDLIIPKKNRCFVSSFSKRPALDSGS
jgi:hypothetical protein